MSIIRSIELEIIPLKIKYRGHDCILRADTKDGLPIPVKIDSVMEPAFSIDKAPPVSDFRQWFFINPRFMEPY